MIPVAIHLDQRTAMVTAAVGAVVLSLLVPIDIGLLLVLLAQGLAAALAAGGGALPTLRGAAGRPWAAAWPVPRRPWSLRVSCPWI